MRSRLSARTGSRLLIHPRAMPANDSNTIPLHSNTPTGWAADPSNAHDSSSKGELNPVPKSPRFIVVEGPLRVGKTTLAKILAEKLHARRVYDCDDNPVLSDFLLEKDRIFANLNLDDEELKLYDRYYEVLTAGIPAPDLVIYLQAKPEVLRARIEKKASRDESEISPEYIEEAARAYKL